VVHQRQAGYDEHAQPDAASNVSGIETAIIKASA